MTKLTYESISRVLKSRRFPQTPGSRSGRSVNTLSARRGAASRVMRLSGRPFSQITRITGSFAARARSIKLPGGPPSNHTRSGRPNGALFAGSAVRIDRDLSAGPPGVKMATSWWARLTRWPGVKHPKAREAVPAQ